MEDQENGQHRREKRTLHLKKSFLGGGGGGGFGYGGGGGYPGGYGGGHGFQQPTKTIVVKVIKEHGGGS